MDISFFLIPVSSQISLIAVFFLLAPFFNLPFGNSREFPKGRLKKGANRKKTAIREICEETGIKKKEISILNPLIPTHHHNKVSGSTLVKETFWFFIQYSGNLKKKLTPALISFLGYLNIV